MRAGYARTVISPPPGTYLAGFAARHDPAREIHDDLWARALVLEDGDRRVAFVVYDLCEIDAAFVAAVRRTVQEATGITPDAVMMAATHTHAAPATIALYSPPPDAAWLEALPARVTHAVAAAAHHLAPATVGVGFGRETSVARNRRRPDGPVDHTVGVLRVDRPAEAPALLVHYACHPTVLGPDNLQVSRDYPGFALDAIEQTTRGWALFANGACGDVNVGHSVDRSALGLALPGRTFERAADLGGRLAREALRVASGTRTLDGGLAAGSRSLAVPLRPTPPPDEMHAQVRVCRARLRTLEAAHADEETLMAARLELLYAELGLTWVEERGGAETETVEVQAFALGNVAFVGLPGEFFAESGLRLKAQSPFPQTIIVGYANGGAGYVPPAAAFIEGGYETRLAPWSKMAPEAEQQVLDAAVALLGELKTP